ncbi:GntR family transcriptional regulator [Corynebacterium sp. S7]
MDNEAEPLFRQIATLIADAIVDGEYTPGDRVASTNDLAHFHEINPATARKGLALLRDEGILENRRGVGTFVAPDARERIVESRSKEFAGTYIAPLIDEAVRLNYSRAELHELVERVAESRGMYQ